jgi:glycosyltransferase involved in cell wall biosynthesis
MQVNKKIRILETIRQGQIGGGESHLLSLVENLDKNIFEPVVLSFTPGPMVDKLQQMNIPVHVIYTEKPFDVSKWKRVKNLLQAEKIQMVHAHGTRACSNVFWAAKKLSLPLVYTIHGWSFHDDQNPLVKKIRIMGERLLTKTANMNIAVAATNRQTGINNFGDFKSVVINNGINQNKFNPTLNFTEVRTELGIQPDETLVVFVARFIHQKQPLLLIKSFAKALQQNSKLKLLLVGDGDQKMEALQIVKDLQIESNIIFEPFRADVPDVLAAADIYVLPSLWEGLPIGLLEAMAMGKAIIGTLVDGTKEVIEHDVNGLLLPLDNIEHRLAFAITDLANNAVRRKQLGIAARATVTEKFSAEKMTWETEQVYFDVLKKSND